MADYDFLTAKQRISILRNIQRALEDAIRAARDAQLQYDSRVKNGLHDLHRTLPYVDYQDINGDVQNLLNVSRDHALRAKEELDDLLATYTGADTNTYYPNFVQKYKFEVGVGGVDSINFDGAAQDIQPISGGASITNIFNNGGKPTSHATYILNEDDLIVIEGTELNDGTRTVAIATSDNQTIGVDADIVTENCTTRGASVTAYRRTL